MTGGRETTVDEKLREAVKFIVKEVREKGIKDPVKINRIKYRAVRLFRLGRVPSNVEILKYVNEIDPELASVFRLKPVRSISGVVIVAIMTYPYECPHGRCLYCPHYPGAPISYTGKEPSAMRGIHNEFDPYKQVTSRLEQLESMGHSTDKVEIIIQGGTFNATPLEYREWYMRRLLQAFIGYYPESFEKGVLDAEKSPKRIVGITFETRPDACSEEQINWMLERGGTRVELGVQTIYDDVYKYVDRGHSIQDVIEATRRLRDAGFKVTYHLMPGLPLTNFKHDLNIFNLVFSSHNYMPDNLKIYPTLVLEHTGLLEIWRSGGYKPYDTEIAKDLVSLVKGNIIPPWIRIMRVNRDIPSHEIIDGVKKTNLRQIVQMDMRKIGLRCRCIRCREAGHRWMKEGYKGSEELVIKVSSYPASGGIEYFISVEDVENDVIYGFIRLRRPSNKAWRPEITSSETYIVRELHVYGHSLPLGSGPQGLEGSWQHIGLGSILLSEAEKLASSLDGEKIVVISGIGVREYYYKHGYNREGPYVSKFLGG
jgi:elongator complex protein 3